MFHSAGAVDGAHWAFTDRFGGVSAPPYAELNLGYSAGDDRAAVTRNLESVRKAMGVVHLVRMRQVHGRDVTVVRTDDDIARAAEAPPFVDALVTDRRDVVLMAQVADCVPVLLFDAEAGVLGAVHAGREGMVAGVLAAAVEGMAGLGAASCAAVIGPHICGRCYEVPAELQARVLTGVPEAAATTRWGTPGLDLAAGAITQLQRLGVRLHQVVDACSFESDSLYSYRRLGRVSGRMAGLICWT